jgi:hypothetical protein
MLNGGAPCLASRYPALTFRIRETSSVGLCGALVGSPAIGAFPWFGAILALPSVNFPRAPCLASRYPALTLRIRETSMWAFAARRQAMVPCGFCLRWAPFSLGFFD